MDCYFLLSLERNDFGIKCFVEFLLGAGGNRPTFPNNQDTLSEGCAPTDNQYFTRELSAVISLTPSFPGNGL